MTACVGLLAQELATGIFAAKKDASTVDVPMPSSAMDCSGWSIATYMVVS